MAIGRRKIEDRGRSCVNAAPVKISERQSTDPVEDQNTDSDPDIRPIIGPRDTEASTRPVSKAAPKL